MRHPRTEFNPAKTDMQRILFLIADAGRAHNDNHERLPAAFRAAGCTAKTTMRRVDSITLTSHGDLVDIDIRGNAFLRQMVRIIVGTLTEVGTGQRPVAQVAEILASKLRTQAGITAPAHGLELVEVRYDGSRPRAAEAPV